MQRNGKGMDAMQRTEAEEPACVKMHDPAFKFLKSIFRKKLLFNFLVKNGKLLIF